MKKLIASILSFSLIFSLMSPAFAVNVVKVQDGIIGEIVYENTINTIHNVAPTISLSEDTIHSVVSATINQDESITYYEYANDKLTQYHTFIPGSGIMSSTYINNDGTERTEVNIFKSQNNTQSINILPTIETGQKTTATSRSFIREDYTRTYSNINTPDRIRPLGYMHYRHFYTDVLYSIDCELKERDHKMEEYTFNESTGGKISFWLGVLGSVFGLAGGPAGIFTKFATSVVMKWINIGLIVLGAGTTYFGVGSKTFRCNWYEQEIHGTPTAPNNTGTEIYLSGIYAFVDYDDGKGLTVETEGFTARDWGDPAMGRWMMYKVFGIDEVPSSWTGID